MTEILRAAKESDAEGILGIYAPIVRDTTISFELEPPTVEQMRQRIADTLPKLPWLVLETAEGVAAYAYASEHRNRLAYQWSVDVSVYVAPQSHRRGYGRRLYQTLLEILSKQGYYNAFAGIALPNEASVGLHEALGFKPIAVYQKVGYKLGAWRDVGWWGLTLREHDGQPSSPKKFSDLGWNAELA